MTAEETARRVAAGLAGLPGVEAVALGGSHGAGTAGPGSDIDLYVYAAAEPPVPARAALVATLGAAGRTEIGNRLFEPCDEWEDAASGLSVDVMYRAPAWIEDRLTAVLDRHQPALGYTTCLWFNARHSRALFDPSGWFGRLQATAAQPYPEPLRRAVIDHNMPMLRCARSSFLHQLERAAERDDPVAVGHRSTAFLASWFDVLLAFHRMPHPGEKRLLAHARRAAVIDVEVGSVLRRMLGDEPGERVAAAHALAGYMEVLVEGG